jgi:hypothetical protein
LQLRQQELADEIIALTDQVTVKKAKALEMRLYIGGNESEFLLDHARNTRNTYKAKDIDLRN